MDQINQGEISGGQSGSRGPTISAIIIVILLILGGIYLLLNRQTDESTIPPPAEENINNGGENTLNTLPEPTTADLESEAAATDLSDLESETADLNAELE